MTGNPAKTKYRITWANYTPISTINHPSTDFTIKQCKSSEKSELTVLISSCYRWWHSPRRVKCFPNINPYLGRVLIINKLFGHPTQPSLHHTVTWKFLPFHIVDKVKFLQSFHSLSLLFFQSISDFIITFAHCSHSSKLVLGCKWPVSMELLPCSVTGDEMRGGEAVISMKYISHQWSYQTTRNVWVYSLPEFYK